MIRKIDNLGRIVIPKEIRKELNIKDYDELKITTDGKQVIITKAFLTDDEIKAEIDRLKTLLNTKKSE